MRGWESRKYWNGVKDGSFNGSFNEAWDAIVLGSAATSEWSQSFRDKVRARLAEEAREPVSTASGQAIVEWSKKISDQRVWGALADAWVVQDHDARDQRSLPGPYQSQGKQIKEIISGP